MKLESSNKFLQSAFEWAAEKTKIFVVTGTKNGEINKGEGNKWYGPNKRVIRFPYKKWAKPQDYKPAFWAGYFDRTAYYIRDFVHQASGAYIVGLEKELYNMYYTFVSNASEETGWFAPWAFNFDNTVYYMDTPNYKKFVREITTCPHFPKDIDDIKLTDLKFGDYTVDIKIENNKAVIKNSSPKAVLWHCNFIKNDEMIEQSVTVHPNETTQCSKS